MSDFFDSLRRWFRSLVASEGQQSDRDDRRDRDKRDSHDKHERRARQRESRFAALSPETRWAAEAEAEYTAPRGSSDAGGRTVVAPYPSPPVESPNPAMAQVQPVAAASPHSDSPVPNGAAPFAAAMPGLRDDEVVEDTVAGEPIPTPAATPAPASDEAWHELWEADGLVSHDGTWLRFQSWDGRHDIQVLMGDMRASVKGDNLRIHGEAFRVDIEDVEPLRPPFAGRDDLARTARPSKGDPFGGLLEEFPHLGHDAS